MEDSKSAIESGQNLAYNPYEHRVVEQPLSNLEASASLLKSVIGTGMLAMPLAFYYAGIINGTILTILAAMLLIYGMHLLIHCMTECATRKEQPQVTFPEAMAYSFANGPNWCKPLAGASGVFVNIVLGFCHYSICVAYIVFVASNIRQLVTYYWKDMSRVIYIVAVTTALIPLFLIRHLKYLVPFNVVANCAMYSGCIGIFYYVFQELPPIGQRKMFQSPELLPLFFGIVLFALTSVGVTLAVESKMAKPQDYLGICGILNRSMIIIIITNVFFGIFGYWRYGSNIAGSITLNVPQDELLSQYTKFSIAVGIFLTFPLSGYITIDVLMNHYIIPQAQPKNPYFIECVLRVSMLFLAMLNAIVFPNLGPLLALVGSLTISVLNVIFPATMHLCLRYTTGYGAANWMLWKDILLIFIGVVILIFGSEKAIKEITTEYLKAGNATVDPSPGQEWPRQFHKFFSHII